MVLRDGLRPPLTGLAMGLGVGALTRMGLQPIFVRLLPAFDPAVVLTVPVLFVAIAIAACYLPARRASHVDPNEALRHL